MSSKPSHPRRRQTLAYPSPPSSIDSVSSCSSFSSASSSSSSSASSATSSYSPSTSPTYTKEFSFEPQSDYYSIPPPNAQFFPQRVHKVPQRMTKREEWKLWYSANFATNLLEPWENILIHLLFALILALTYVALSRLLSLATLSQLGSRLRFYATGGGGTTISSR